MKVNINRSSLPVQFGLPKAEQEYSITKKGISLNVIQTEMRCVIYQKTVQRNNESEKQIDSWVDGWLGKKTKRTEGTQWDRLAGNNQQSIAAFCPRQRKRPNIYLCRVAGAGSTGQQAALFQEFTQG